LRFAEVAVDSPVGARRAFTYMIPEGVQVRPGQSVLAPFGPRLLSGVVLGLSDESPLGSAHDLRMALDPELGLNPLQIGLARWIAERYYCGLYEAAALMLPPGLAQAIEIRACAAGGEGPLSMAEAALLALLRRRGPLPAPRLRRLWPDPGRETLLQALERAGRVERRLAWRPPRLSPAGDPPAPETPPALTPFQARALAVIRRELEAPLPRPVLVHGVTGSGKTELYLRALAQVLADGQQALVLVPEIALTPLLIARFEARFPGKVAALHSGLTPAQRRRAWWRVKRGEAPVVIGSRSAIFAPVGRPGLIVLDEEHEWTYKQQEVSPRYHARDVALELARRSGALVLLGSATPSLESYQAARSGVFQLVRLPERVGVRSGECGVRNAPPHPGHGVGRGIPHSALPTPHSDGLPKVAIVDMRAELRAGHLGLFSRALEDALAATLVAGEQAIFFLNRRGAATIVLCRQCGHVLRCRRCDTPLTFHRDGAELVCHQCSERRPPVERCPACNSRAIRYFGAGTQRVEGELHARFPAARVLRWDRDSASTARAHAEILRRFEAHEADVLVGTQMLTKGLDLPRVTLVGAVSADTALFLPDFRSAERTFQLLVQVAGRAGRRGWPGRVLIQTYQPQHPAIRAVATHNYAAFAAGELAYRLHHRLPPYRRLARLVLLHPNAEAAAAEAVRLRARVDAAIAERGLGNLEVLGPAPAFLSRRRGRYRWQIVLRGGFEPLLAELSLGPGWSVDVDPASLL
jgi:primosomal protein N' (replication factor Y)